YIHRAATTRTYTLAYTTLFRSRLGATRNQRGQDDQNDGTFGPLAKGGFCRIFERIVFGSAVFQPAQAVVEFAPNSALSFACGSSDRKSTRLNSMHVAILYAVFF